MLPLGLPPYKIREAKIKANLKILRMRPPEGGASYVPTDLGHVKMKRDIRPTYEVTHVKDT